MTDTNLITNLKAFLALAKRCKNLSMTTIEPEADVILSLREMGFREGPCYFVQETTQKGELVTVVKVHQSSDGEWATEITTI